MATPKYVELELQWREEQLKMHKRFKEWLQVSHPEIFKEYDRYILGKIIVGEVLRKEENRTTIKKFKMRPFTRQDWQGFGGCEADDEHQPWIRGGEDWIGVSDKNGVEINFATGGGEWDSYFSESDYEKGKMILEALPDVVTRHQLVNLGFKKL